MATPQCSFISLTDVELSARISCAKHRLVMIAPGLSESVATVLVAKWRELGSEAVQIVLDSDPEVCRLGLGDSITLELLQRAGTELGAPILRQEGLRIGLVITDEAITVFSPTPLLIEAGGRPGEKRNAIQIDEAAVAAAVQPASPTHMSELNLNLAPIQETDVKPDIMLLLIS